MNPEGRKDDKDLIFAILDLIYEDEKASQPDSDKAIREAGKDPDALVRNDIKLLEKIKANIQREALGKKKAAFDEVASRIKSAYQEMKDLKSGKERKEALLRIFGAGDRQLAFSYRKLEELSDNDLAAVDSEEKLLEIWTEFLSKTPKET